jgi:NifU-like protein
MRNADDLLTRVSAPQAAEVLMQSRRRVIEQPWTAAPLRMAGERKLRQVLQLGAHWKVQSFSTRFSALSALGTWSLQKSIQQGKPHISVRDDCPADILEPFESWKGQGVVLRPAQSREQVSRRSLVWVQGWGDRETGEIASPASAPDSWTVLDISLSMGQLSIEPSFWNRDWQECAVVIMSLEGLLGLNAPTLIFWQDHMVAFDFRKQPTDGPDFLAAASAFEETQGLVDGWGFESSRKRASWEDRCRVSGGQVCAEAAERLPGLSAVRFPGRSTSYLRGLLFHKGIWTGIPSGPSWEALSYGRVPEKSCIFVAATEGSWTSISQMPEEFWSSLKRSEKLAEGLICWPILQSDPDELWNHPKVMQRAFRTLYCGQLKQEYAVDGLRLVKASFRSRGVEGLLAILVDEEDGVIVDAAYQAFGPPTWVALGEVLCEHLIRKNHREAAQIHAGLIESSLFAEETTLIGATLRWCNNWIEGLEECLRACEDISCPAPLVTPLSLEGLEPGEPYPGWDIMDIGERTAVIEAVLDEHVRPYIAMDAGGLHLLNLQELNLHVAFSGTCTSCPSSMGSTLHAIQQTLRARVHPELVVIPELNAPQLA